MTVLKEGIFKLEAIQKRLEEGWNKGVSLPSIRQVLLENGLIETREIGGDFGLTQGELFDTEDGGQLYLDFDCDCDCDTDLDKTVPEQVEEEKEGRCIWLPLYGGF